MSESLDLGQFGAPGFSLDTRVDFSRHGGQAPHVNTDLVNPNGEILRRTGPNADFRDITNVQLPGFNNVGRSS